MNAKKKRRYTAAKLGLCVTCPKPVPAKHRTRKLDGELHGFCDECFAAINEMVFEETLLKRRVTANARYKKLYSSPYPGGSRHSFNRSLKGREINRKMGLRGVDIRDLGNRPSSSKREGLEEDDH